MKSPINRCLLVLLLLLPGCSLVKTGYHLSDWWIARQVDRYVDWTAAQEAEFDAELAAVMKWHRDTQLPHYRDWLLAVRDDLREPVDAQRLARRATQSEKFFTRISERALPSAARLLASLSPQQIDDLERELKKRQRELEDQYLDENQRERFQRRRKLMLDNIERFTGNLGPAQRALVNEWAAWDSGSTELWLDNRAQWIEHFLHRVRSHRDAQSLEQALRPLLLDPPLDADYAQRLADNQRRVYRLLAAVHSTLDEGQRQHLDDTLGQWAGWMNELAGAKQPDQLAGAPP